MVRFTMILMALLPSIILGKLHLAHLTTAYGLEAKLISTASGCDPGKLNWMLVVKKSYFQNCAGLYAD